MPWLRDFHTSAKRRKCHEPGLDLRRQFPWADPSCSLTQRRRTRAFWCGRTTVTLWHTHRFALISRVRWSTTRKRTRFFARATTDIFQWMKAGHMRGRQRARFPESNWSSKVMRSLQWGWKSDEHPPGPGNHAFHCTAVLDWDRRCGATLAVGSLG